METVSTKLPDEEADRFERIVLAKRLQGADTTKSQVVRDLVREWIDENEDVLDDVDGLDDGGE